MQEFEISTDKSRLDLEMIHRFLSEKSYWARKRALEQTKTAIENSICFGLYEGRRQIGFARVVTDKATFAYLGDVFVLDGFRGEGLGKWLMSCAARGGLNSAVVLVRGTPLITDDTDANTLLPA